MTLDLKELEIGEKLADHIAFTNKVTSYIKERADLERDFAKRLDNLVKRHTPKKKSFSTAIGITAEEPTAINGDISSTIETWDRILEDTLEQSKLHNGLADTLIFSVAERLKELSIRKEESRKKAWNKYMAECEKYNQDLQKCKSEYDATCDAVEAAKGRCERAAAERIRERLKRLLHQDILDMNNQKNMYLLSLGMINQFEERKIKVEIPSILKEIQDFGTSCNSSILKIWKQYVDAQTGFFKEHILILDETKHLMGTANPGLNTEIILPKPLTTVDSHVYEPCGLWTDDNELVTDEYSVVFLGNKLESFKKNQRGLGHRIEKAQSGIQGLEKLYQSFVKNPLAGNPDVILDSMVGERQSLLMLEQEQFKYQCLIDSIIDKVGEFPKGSRTHLFKASSFAFPTTCNYCHQIIWGVTRTGQTCQDCKFNCHQRCEMKVAPSCSGVKGIIDSRKRRSVSDSFRPRTPRKNHTADSTQKNIADAHSDEPNGNDFRKEMTEISQILSHATLRPNESASNQFQETMEEIQVLNDTTLILDSEKALELCPGSLAQVLYDYFATNPTEVNIHEGEHVVVVELDGGSGWTLVSKSGVKGIVPTSYIRAIVSNISSETLKTSDESIPPLATALYSYKKNSPEEMSVCAGEQLRIIRQGWVEVSNNDNHGLIPAAYILMK